MIKKCDHPGCDKAGTCRAPKNRNLRDYWYFCQKHAAEYNKNWNYYADMTPEEIEADWERQTFGAPLKDKAKANADAKNYEKFLKDFIMGRATFDKILPNNLPSSKVVNALRTFDLAPTASWHDVRIKYRALAKKFHPDTANDKTNAAHEFTKISAAYEVLKKHFENK